MEAGSADRVAGGPGWPQSRPAGSSKTLREAPHAQRVRAGSAPEQRGRSSLTAAEARELGDLYRAVTSDLALAQRNRELQAEVEDLRQGLEAVEERARSELGLIKQDEEFYQVVPRQEKQP